MISLNERAWQRLEKAVEERDSLNIVIHPLDCGARLLDAGIYARGGLEAGLTMAEVASADLLTAQIEFAPFMTVPWPWVVVHSDRPYEACMLSQAAAWDIHIGDFRAMGSGPACLLNHTLAVAGTADFEEKSDCAVLVLETRQLPDEQICRALADACGVRADRLTAFVAPTSSLAGSAQIAARSFETGLHKLHTLGFDLRKVASGAGRCPIAAPTGDDLLSLGRTNDLMMFASQVWMAFYGVPDEDLATLAEKFPASACMGYGLSFLEALKNAGGFYQLDPGLFAPAEVSLISLESGAVFHAGGIDTASLERVLKG